MTETLKLGTRRSLLAWAQSSWAAREIERLNPGFRVELVGIETRGDQIQDVPLQSVPGKEFFVAELDDALSSGAVDLTVHSMKDLSLDRPPAFACAAIPPRENPRDVILFGPGVYAKIAQGRTLKIGTSSPRRLENIPPFLERALPRLGEVRARVELVEIRGNVNTRLGRVHEAVGMPKQLDAVVLAFAGLIRLWNDPHGRWELSRLLRNVRWMILPLRECPAAPAQGALAVECRAGDARVRDAVARLHDADTARRVGRERQLLADWGGGCHQKFGATCLEPAGTGSLLFVRGKKPDETFVDELRWAAPARPPEKTRVIAWDGSVTRGAPPVAAAIPSGRTIGELEDQALFLAHSRALPAALAATGLRGARVWTSGTSSWFRLAEQGIWVEGCAEGLGYDLLAPTLREGVLGLPSAADWKILTHEAAASGWEGQVLATYRVEADRDPESKDRLRAATHVYWSSGSQFDGLKGMASAQAHHACGPGKTAEHLRRNGLAPAVFPSAEEWRKWLKI